LCGEIVSAGETYINDPRRRPIHRRRHPIRHRMTPIVMRLHACSDRFENGRIFLPVDAPWLDDYIVELIGFPGTKYDDQVDSTTQALDHMREDDVLATYLKAFGR
jgi:phage terminase large subunit-like protein